jgi:hypothetical protein
MKRHDNLLCLQYFYFRELSRIRHTALELCNSWIHMLWVWHATKSIELGLGWLPNLSFISHMFIKLILFYIYIWLLSSLNFLDLTYLSIEHVKPFYFSKLFLFIKILTKKKVYCTPKSHKLHYIAKVRKQHFLISKNPCTKHLKTFDE